MLVKNRTGPNTLPWGTPSLTGRGDERILSGGMCFSTRAEVSGPCVEVALDAVGREFEEQGGVPDWIKSSRCVERDSHDLLCDTEDIHP